MDWEKARRFAGLILAFILVVSFGAVAEISFRTGGSGEATWYEDGCSGEGVELGTWNDGDWSAVLLDCSARFTFDQIIDPLTIDYYHLRVQTQPATCGPRIVVLVEQSTLSGPVQYVVISEEASYDPTPCATYAPRGWYYAQWDGTSFDTYGTLGGYAAEQQPGTGSFLDLQAATDLIGADVLYVGALMGAADIVGDADVLGGDDLIGLGQAVIDLVTLRWTDSGLLHGGLYDLEQPWPDPFTYEDAEEFAPANPNGWLVDGLWKRIHSSDLYDESATIQTFPSGDYAAYFGSPVPNTGMGSYNGTGTQVRGTLESPYNFVNPGDEFITVKFDHYREVESYTNGQFDQTYVQIWFNGSTWGTPGDPYWGGTSPWAEDPWNVDDAPGGWKTIWYLDSSDASIADWAHVAIDSYPDKNGVADQDFPIMIPNDATEVKIRFYFDSVDGYNNDYLGWIVDDVIKQHSPDPTENHIITEALKQAEINVPYIDTLLANQTVVRWDIVSVTKEDELGRPVTVDGLPMRLALDHGSGDLWGTAEPGTAGTYQVTVKATFRNGHPGEIEKTLQLAVRPESGTPNEVASEDFGPPLFGQSWTVDGAALPPVAGSCPNLWHESSANAIGIPDPGGQYGEVGYFGKDESGDRDDANYACTRAKGTMTSQLYAIHPDLAGEPITVGFKSWRQVESYTGAYDKTWVQLRFEGEEWQTIWEKDSSDPSKADWTWEEIATGLYVPDPPSRKLQVRFCFDSIDGYNNDTVGWAVDEITIYAGSSQLSIANTCPMPETSAGHYYKEELKPSGGPNGRRVFRIVAGQLPPGLLLHEDIATSKWWIEGIPRDAGEFGFTLILEIVDGGGQVIEWVEKACSIVVGGQVILLYEDFEDDPVWNWAELWHRTEDGGVQGVDGLSAQNHAAYYGQADAFDPNYNTGARTVGSLMLTSPIIDLTGATNGVGAVAAVKVIFDFWREVEFFSNKYDFTKVQVKLDDGDWKSIWERNSSHVSQAEWITEDGIAPFLTAGASTMLIRFSFDSVDGWYNFFTGWLIDNINVEVSGTDGAISLDGYGYGPTSVRGRDVQQISVMNTPNPVRDVHTTTFTVRAAGVEAMRVEIYDLDQNLVFEEEVFGNEIEYHTTDKYGDYLANGVYFYRAIVLINDIWHETTFQKLIILR